MIEPTMRHGLASTDPQDIPNPGERSGRRLEVLTLAIGIVLAIGLITAPFPGDPMDYLDAAENLPSTPLHHGSTRLGLTVPVWLLTLIFGYSEISLYTYPILAFASLALATMIVGRQLFGRWVGLGAAALVVTSPWVLPYGTQLLPDIPSAALITVSFGLALAAAPKERGTYHKAWLAGLFFGLAYMVKETSLLFGPALVLVMLICGHRMKSVARFVLAAAGVAVLEMIAGLVLWGDPFARLRALLMRSDAVAEANRVPAFEQAFAAQQNPLKSFSIFLQLLWDTPHGKLMMVLGGALLIAATFAGQRFRALAMWLLLPWILFALVGSIQPESGRPVIRLMLDRYWVPLLPPLAIGGLGAVVLLAERLKRTGLKRLVVVAGALMAMLMAGMGIWASLQAHPDWFVFFGNKGYWELRATFRELKDSPVVYIDRNPSKLARLYTNDAFGTRVLDGTLTADPEHIEVADIVVVDFSHSQGSPDVEPPGAITGHSAVAVAAPDDLRWAMYGDPDAVDPASKLIETERLHIESWNHRVVTGDDFGPSAPLGSTRVALTSDQRLVAFDFAGPYGAAPTEETVNVDAGATVSFVVRLDIEGGNVRAICDFYPDGDHPAGETPRTRVQANSLLDEGPTTDVLFGLCEAPSDAEVYSVRLVVVARGPTQVELAEGWLAAHAVSSATD